VRAGCDWAPARLMKEKAGFIGKVNHVGMIDQLFEEKMI